MPNDDIVYLLKFASKEAYINDLMDRRLYLNTAGYYCGLPSERGDPLEASLSYGMGIQANRLLPIYCISKVRGGTVDNAVAISKRMIEEFRYRQLDWHRAVRPLRAVAKSDAPFW